MKIAAPRSNSSEEYKKPISVTRGLYGGMFKSYSLPKQYTKYKSTEMEEKFFVTFLLTHDAGGRPLPAYSEAFCGIRTKRFYDSSKDLATTYVRFLDALLNGKMTPEQIADCDDDELPDIDELIGYPAALFVKPGESANGIDTQNGGFMRADAVTRKAISGIYKTSEMGYSSKNQLRYLMKPECTYQDDAAQSETIAQQSSSHNVFDEIADDEIPF